MTRAGIAALITSLLLALTACQDDPEPNATPHPTSPSPTTANSSPSPTFDPKNETAEQFIRRWYSMSNRAQRSGDVRQLSAVVMAGCGSCHTFIRSIDSAYEKGGFVRTQGSRVVQVKALGPHEWHVEIVSGVTRIKRSKNEKVQRYTGGREVFTMYLRKIDGAWKIEDYLLEEQ